MNESLKFCLRNHEVCSKEYALRLKEWIIEEAETERDKSKALRTIGVMRQILDKKNLPKSDIDKIMVELKYEIDTEKAL